jgi:hypothetical protein
LRDLVRVGSQMGRTADSGGTADCTGDGVVNLFDLLLVATNYGTAGPIPWAQDGAAAQQVPAPDTRGLRDLVRWTFGPAGGAAVDLVVGPADANQVMAEIVARNVDKLYGADIGLEVDPSVFRILDTSTRAGVQALAGARWGSDDESFVAVNRAEPGLAGVRFAVTRSAPATPLSGDVVIATVLLEQLSKDATGAMALDHVELMGPDSQPIASRWVGVDREGGRLIHIPYADKLSVR